MSIENENKKQQGEEFYDMGLGLFAWADNANDYKLVAELIPKSKTTWDLIKTLDEINQLLPGDVKLIFDGTISSLRYFVENKLVKLKDIKNPLLREAAFKHLYKPSQTKDIKMNLNRWSGQALRCKAISIGLFIQNRKLTLPNGSAVAEDLENLKEWDFPVFDNDIENERLGGEAIRKLTTINSLWVGLISGQPWNEYKTETIGEFIIERVLESFWIQNSYINMLFQKLQPYIDKVAEKYFPEFHTKDHRACVAIRHAAIIVLYRLIDYLPKNAQRHSTLRVDGFLNKFIEYIFTSDFEFQKWFLDYFNSEMEKRTRFIKVLGDEGIIIPLIKEKRAIRYIPVFESFRFMVRNEIALLPVELVRVFRNKNFSIEDKDEIARNIVFNIQKLVTFKNEAEQYETSVRESLCALVLSIFEPLERSIARKQICYHPRLTEYDNFQDLIQIIDVEMLGTILKYDASKNSSFFGYMKKMLPFNVHSEIRPSKIEQSTETLDMWSEAEVRRSAIDKNTGKIDDSKLGKFTRNDVEKNIISDELKNKLLQCFNDLPPKEMRAIKKAYYHNEEAFTNAERKAKNRAFERLRKLHPELRKFL